MNMSKKTLLIIVLAMLSWLGINAQNNYLEFDGDDDYVSSDLEISNYTAITIEAWVYAHSFNPSDPDNNISNLVVGGNETTVLRIGDDTIDNNQPQFVLDIGGHQRLEATTRMDNNTWYHIAGVWDGSTMKIYINGVMENSQSMSGTMASTTASTLVGGATDSRFLDGYMDEVRIWDDARTKTEIRQNMYREIPNPTSETNLVSYYKFNETSGTSASDASQNTNTGTLNGGFNFTDNADPSAAFFGPKNCLVFDGSNEYVAIGSGPSSLNTVELWVYPETTSVYLLDLNGSAYIWINSGTVTATGFTSPTIYVDGHETTTVSADKWQHIAVTTSSSIDANNLDIGRQGSNYFKGKIDELRIWSEVRTQDSIIEHMCSALTGNESNLVAYYTFDNTEDKVLQDFSGSDYDGTLQNMEDADWISSSAFNTWLNTNSTNWNADANWSLASVPNSSTENVGIPDHSTANDPEVSTGTEVNNLVVGSGADLTFNHTGTHVIHGSVFNIGHTTLKSNTDTEITGSLYFLFGSSLDIESNASLSVDKNLEIDFLLSSGDLTIKSDVNGTGSLIVGGSSDGDVNVQCYLTDNSWHLVTPSTTDITANDFYWNDAPKSWLTYHTESVDSWTYNTDLSTPMPVGQGWAVWLDDNTKTDATATMEGDLRTTDLTLGLDYTDASHGFNLVGNPFTSAIDYHSGSWDSTNVEGTIWVWQNSSDQYLYRTQAGGGTMTNGIIPVSQGFFVRAKAASPSLTIPADARTHNSQAFYKNANSNNNYESYMTIRSSYDIAFDEVWISFGTNGTFGFDNGYDASKFFGGESAPQMYLREQSKKLSIDHLPILDENGYTVKMSYIAGEDGQQDLVANLEFLQEIEVTLEDLFADITQNLNNNPVYSFSANKNDDPDRFLIHFISNEYGIDKPSFDENENITIYSQDKMIIIYSQGKAAFEKGSVIICNLLGQTVIEQEIDAETLISIPIETYNNYFIVKVIKPSGFKTEKVFIK